MIIVVDYLGMDLREDCRDMGNGVWVGLHSLEHNGT